MVGFLAPLPPPFGGGVNLIFAAILGTITGGALGYLINRFMFRPAPPAGVSLIAQMVMTIGLSILHALATFFFGGGPRTFGDYAAQRAVKFGPVELTQKDIVAIVGRDPRRGGVLPRDDAHGQGDARRRGQS